MPTTARLALPYPTGASSANVPADLQALATALDQAGIWGQGLLSARPAAAGVQGRMYWATDTGLLYINNGTAWFAIGPAGLGADSITTAMLQALAVTTAKLADGSVTTVKIADVNVTTAKIAAAAVDTSKIAASLKPSGGAGGGTEALRALGTTAGTALAGDAAVATPVAAVVSVGNKSNGATYTLAAPATGTYILEWGMANSIPQNAFEAQNITNNKTAGAAVSYTGMPALRTAVVLNAAEVITFICNCQGSGQIVDPWAKLTRIA